MREQKTFLDGRDRDRTESFAKNCSQDLCQGSIQTAKRMTKTIHNELRYGYNYEFSFSTAVYSDRYFKYGLTLDTNLMPMKCFLSNDLGSLVLYKKFSKFQKNHLDLFINFIQNTHFSTRHYMPIFTSWSIKPYSPGSGPLLRFDDASQFYSINRRFSYQLIYEDLQKYSENNRHVNENYRPLYDVAARCREILDYDEFIYNYARVVHINHKQLQPLIYLENKELGYRLPEKSMVYRSLSKDQIQEMSKQVEKHVLHLPPMITKSDIATFPIPDFALSDDQLLMRRTGSLYEKIKSDPDKLYGDFVKESPHRSATNLVNAEIHQSVKTVYKTYSTGGKKVLNTEIRKRSLSIDRDSTPGKSYYNNDRTAADNLNTIEKYEERSTAPSTLPHLDRNNMIVMEPLLLMQTLNEDRQRRRYELSIKRQKIIIRVMLTYSTVVYSFALIMFYFYSLS